MSDRGGNSRSDKPLAERLACSVNEATEFTSPGRTKVYEVMSEGKLAYKTVGKRRIILIHGPRFAGTRVRGRGRDIVADFEQGADTIDLRRVDALEGPRNQSFRFLGLRRFTGAGAELRYGFAKGDTIISGDTDGDRRPDLQIELAGEFTLRRGDFRR